MFVNNRKCIIYDYSHINLDNIEKFSLDRVNSSKTLYSKRGSSKSSKLYLDIYTGAIAELCLYNILIDSGIQNINYPDFNIYDKANKSFDADFLINNKTKIHCKSQTIESASKYGISYLCQKFDPMFINYDCYDFIACCVVDDVNKLFFLYGIYSLKKIINNNLISEPAVFHLRKNKIALYLEDLKVLNKDARWGLFRKQTGNPVFKYKDINSYKYYYNYAILMIDDINIKVDVEDIPKILEGGKWYIDEKGYVKNKNYKYLHQCILDYPNSIIDHIDRDPFNNLKNNLRLCNKGQNSRNQSRPYHQTLGEFSSKYKGVNKRRDGSNRWVVYISINGKSKYVGDFNTEEEAAMAYNKKAIEFFGEFAYLNEVSSRE